MPPDGGDGIGQAENGKKGSEGGKQRQSQWRSQGRAWVQAREGERTRGPGCGHSRPAPTGGYSGGHTPAHLPSFNIQP